MEIRSLIKKTKQPNSPPKVESDKRKNEETKKTLEKPKNLKQPSQKEAGQWGWLLTGLGLALVLGNPLSALLFSLLIGVKMTQHEQQIRQKREEIEHQLNLELQKRLPRFFKQLSIVAQITSLFAQDNYNRLSFSIGLNLPNNIILASLGWTPAEKQKARVFYDVKKEKLCYKKPKIQTRPFSPDPLEQFTLDLKSLEIDEPALDTSSVIKILVLAESLTLWDCNCQQLGDVQYLCVNGIYIVEQSELETFMTHLLSSHLESNTLTNASSIVQRFPRTIAYIDAILLLLTCLSNIGKSQSFFFLGFWHLYCINNFSDLSFQMSSAIQEEAEYRMAQRLVEKLSRPGMTFYSILDNSKVNLKSIEQGEMILHLPPDRVFVIFVKNLISTSNKSVKVFYDPAIESLRYRKGNGGKKNFSPDPILKAQKRSNWLLEHEPELIPHPPIPIVVFSDNVILKHHSDTPFQLYGKRQFILHQGVYIVEEKNLPSLIMMLTPKPKTTRRSSKPKTTRRSK